MVVVPPPKMEPLQFPQIPKRLQGQGVRIAALQAAARAVQARGTLHRDVEGVSIETLALARLFEAYIDGDA